MFRLCVLSMLALVLTPNFAAALALGSLEVESRLNQKLDARIELIAAQADEIADLKASLADQAAFDQAGLERPFILTSLRFEVVTHGNSTYIEVSSQTSIREPQLNFIVEVAAPAGRILREYTVLLRPSVADLDRY